MPRVKIKKRDQIRFFSDFYNKTRIDWERLAKELKVCSRTINDWRRAKYTISESSFKIILKLARQKVHIPEYKILPDFWSTKKAAKKGGKETFKRYGLLGTIESRRKGGFISQKNRLLFPERYANCNLRKHISKPQNSAYLAEFIGILLGDGHLDSFQVSITLHKKNDHIYISRVCNMVKKLFSITPAVYYARSGKRKNVAIIVVSSVLFIDFLLAKGLKRGHKVKQQVDVPGWIKKNEVFSKHCLRGLIDTDGCVYSHKHKVYGHDYLNVGINFSNKSIPILKFVYKTLIKLNFSPKIFGKGVNLYRKKEVLRYAKEIGFSNLHHKIRLDKLLEKIS